MTEHTDPAIHERFERAATSVPTPGDERLAQILDGSSRRATRGRRTSLVVALAITMLLIGAAWWARPHAGGTTDTQPAAIPVSTTEPTGALIWFVDGTNTWPPPLEATSMDSGQGAPLAPPGGPATVDWDWAPDLQHVIWVSELPDGPQAALMLARSGDQEGAIRIDTLGSSLDYRGRAFSNDGARFAYAAFTPTGTELRVVDVATAQQTTIGHWADGPNVEVDWSPDGTQLVVGVADGAEPGIFTMRPDGSDVVKISDLHAWRLGWSPTASVIVAEAREHDSKVEGIYVMGADGSNEHRLSPPDIAEISPAWSPDGAWIAFGSHRDQPATTPPDMRDQPQFGTGIYIMRADGSDVRQIAPPPTDVGWAEVWDWLPATPAT
jgi:dipeptidyl aminopeptidase/acylaminoacyl peptidase